MSANPRNARPSTSLVEATTHNAQSISEEPGSGHTILGRGSNKGASSFAQAPSPFAFVMGSTTAYNPYSQRTPFHPSHNFFRQYHKVTLRDLPEEVQDVILDFALQLRGVGSEQMLEELVKFEYEEDFCKPSDALYNAHTSRLKDCCSVARTSRLFHTLSIRHMHRHVAFLRESNFHQYMRIVGTTSAITPAAGYQHPFKAVFGSHARILDFSWLALSASGLWRALTKLGSVAPAIIGFRINHDWLTAMWSDERRADVITRDEPCPVLQDLWPKLRFLHQVECLEAGEHPAFFNSVLSRLPHLESLTLSSPDDAALEALTKVYKTRNLFLQLFPDTYRPLQSLAIGSFYTATWELAKPAYLPNLLLQLAQLRHFTFATSIDSTNATHDLLLACILNSLPSTLTDFVLIVNRSVSSVPLYWDILRRLPSLQLLDVPITLVSESLMADITKTANDGTQTMSSLTLRDSQTFSNLLLPQVLLKAESMASVKRAACIVNSVTKSVSFQDAITAVSVILQQSTVS